MFAIWPGLVLGLAMAFLAGLSDASGTAQALLSAVLGVVSAGALLQYVRRTPEADQTGRNAGWVMVGFGVGLLFGAPSGVLARERIRRHLQSEAVIAEAENLLEAAKGRQRVCAWAMLDGGKLDECPGGAGRLGVRGVPMPEQASGSKPVAVLNSEQTSLLGLIQDDFDRQSYRGPDGWRVAESDVRALLGLIRGKDAGQ